MSVKTLFLENVKKYIRPQTDPVAIKLVFDGAEPPEAPLCPWTNTAIRLPPARA